MNITIPDFVTSQIKLDANSINILAVDHTKLTDENKRKLKNMLIACNELGFAVILIKDDMLVDKQEELKQLLKETQEKNHATE